MEVGSKPSRVGILGLHEQKKQGISLTGFIESETPEGKVLLPMVNFAFLALDDEWNIAPDAEIHSEGCDRRLTNFYLRVREMSDRTIPNRVEEVVGLLRHYDIMTVTIKVRYTEKEIRAYTREELRGLFAACSPEDRLFR